MYVRPTRTGIFVCSYTVGPAHRQVLERYLGEGEAAGVHMAPGLVH